MYGNSDESEVVKAGYLTKSPPGAAPPMSQWRRRWFVLRDSSRVYPLAERHVRLEYYQSESDARKLCDPKGIIDLKNCNRISSVAKLKGHSYVFDICTKERTYHIAAETPTEKYEWMKTLKDLLFTSSTDEVRESQDLEKAEMLRRKSVSKSTTERQHSWGDLLTGQDSKKRPTSCFIPPQESKCPDDNSPRKFQPLTGNKKRPLPPTPDLPIGSLTLQSAAPQPQHHHSATSIATESPPPPLPKPRAKTSADSFPVTDISTPSPTSMTSNLPSVDILVHTPDIPHAYENVSKQTKSDHPPPPVPKPRQQKSSLEEHQPQSSYANVPRYAQTTVPDYEDIDVEDNTTNSHTSLQSNSKSNSVNKIIFLDEEVYGDPDQDVYADVDQDLYTDPELEVESGNTYLYDDTSAQVSNYEVPVNLKSSPITSGPSPGPPGHHSGPPQQDINNRGSNPSLNDIPPVPPPRIKKKRSSIHSSLINLNDDGLYSELQDSAETKDGRISSDDEHYGRLIRCVARERRFSDPEVIPISPRSHSSSPLFFSHKPKQSPPPVPPPYRSSQQYYENTSYGGNSAVRQSNGYT